MHNIATRLFILLFCLLSATSAFSAEEPTPEKQTNSPSTEKANNYSSAAQTYKDVFDEPIDLSGETDFTRQFIHMMLGLAFVIFLMFAGAWILKKLMSQRMLQMNTSSQIKVLERRTLSPKAAIYLLDINGVGVVIAESPTGVSRITEFPLEQNDQPSKFEKIYQKKERDMNEN